VNLLKEAFLRKLEGFFIFPLAWLGITGSAAAHMFSAKLVESRQLRRGGSRAQKLPPLMISVPAMIFRP
jgi:hypothetical protein